MEIIVLGGQKHGNKIKRHFTSSTSLDWKYQHRYEKTRTESNTFQATITQEWMIEEYYIKFITRNNVTRIFYVIESLDVDSINKFSAELWDQTAIAGYTFN